MNYKDLKNFTGLIDDGVSFNDWVDRLKEALSERERRAISDSASQEFLKNLLIFKDDFTYYLFKPTHHLYSFDNLGDLLKGIKDFYKIHVDNRDQIKADRETQTRIMTYLKSPDMEIYSCMNLLMHSQNPEYFLGRIHTFFRYDETVLAPKEFNIPYITTNRILIERKEKYAPFHYKGHDWLITSGGGFWLVGYEQAPDDIEQDLYNLYTELKYLSVETNKHVLHSCVHAILYPR